MAGRVVPDVSVDVGVYEILRRYHEVAEREGEFGPVARLVEAQERLQRRVLRVERRPAKGEGFERRRLHAADGRVRIDRVRHDRTMTCDADLYFERRSALHSDRLGYDGDRLHRTAELRLRSGRVETLAIQILNVGRDVGCAPGDESIPSERHRRRTGKRRADDFEIAALDVGEIPGGRQPRPQMRVVGEKRFAAGGERAVDDPVVRPQPFRPRGPQEEIAYGRRAL